MVWLGSRKSRQFHFYLQSLTVSFRQLLVEHFKISHSCNYVPGWGIKKAKGLRGDNCWIYAYAKSEESCLLFSPVTGKEVSNTRSSSVSPLSGLTCGYILNQNSFLLVVSFFACLSIIVMEGGMEAMNYMRS